MCSFAWCLSFWGGVFLGRCLDCPRSKTDSVHYMTVNEYTDVCCVLCCLSTLRLFCIVMFVLACVVFARLRLCLTLASFCFCWGGVLVFMRLIAVFVLFVLIRCLCCCVLYIRIYTCICVVSVFY